METSETALGKQFTIILDDGYVRLDVDSKSGDGVAHIFRNYRDKEGNWRCNQMTFKGKELGQLAELFTAGDEMSKGIKVAKELARDEESVPTLGPEPVKIDTSSINAIESIMEGQGLPQHEIELTMNALNQYAAAYKATGNPHQLEKLMKTAEAAQARARSAVHPPRRPYAHDEMFPPEAKTLEKRKG